jgi:hypothetical protein
MPLKTRLDLAVTVEYELMDELRGLFLPKMVDIKRVYLTRRQGNGKLKELDILKFLSETEVVMLEDEVMELTEKGES